MDVNTFILKYNVLIVLIGLLGAIVTIAGGIIYLARIVKTILKKIEQESIIAEQEYQEFSLEIKELFENSKSQGRRSDAYIACSFMSNHFDDLIDRTLKYTKIIRYCFYFACITTILATCYPLLNLVFEMPKPTNRTTILKDYF